MLKLASGSDIEEIIKFSFIHPIGVRISSQILSYGLDSSLYSCWLQYDSKGKITAAVGNTSSDLTFVVDDNTDYEELALFISDSAPRSLCGSRQSFLRCGFQACKTRSLFVFSADAPSASFQNKSFDLRDIYDLISEEIPGSFPLNEDSYLYFLSDFTHRSNAGYARATTRYDKGLIACCLTSAEDDSRAIISGVAVKRDRRGVGFGKAIVHSMVASLLSEGKRPYVIALNENAEAFYSKIGFKMIDKVSFYTG